MAQGNSQSSIIAAAIGAIGLVGAAVIANWDKLTGPDSDSDEQSANSLNPVPTAPTAASDTPPLPVAPEPERTQPSQTSTGRNSPNVANVQGNVNIEISDDKSHLRVPDFTTNIDTSAQSAAFEAFLKKHLGQLVHIKAEAPTTFADLYEDEKEGQFLSFAARPCLNPESFALDCKVFELTVRGSDHALSWYAHDPPQWLLHRRRGRRNASGDGVRYDVRFTRERVAATPKGAIEQVSQRLLRTFTTFRSP